MPQDLSTTLSGWTQMLTNFFEKPQNSYIKVLFWLFTSNINFLRLKNKTTKKFASHVSAFDVDVKMKYRVCIFNSREVVLNWTNISNIFFTLWTLKSRCYRRKRLLHFLIMTILFYLILMLRCKGAGNFLSLSFNAFSGFISSFALIF